MKRRIIICATILWMVLIFVFSAQPADTSTDMSRMVGYKVGEYFVSDFESWPVGEQAAFAEKIDFPVRKCAHASEYAVLAVLLMLLTGSFGWTGRKGVLISLLGVTAYAATDELHQLFVPGRSGLVTDVMIDTMGGFLGCLLFWLLMKLTEMVKNSVG